VRVGPPKSAWVYRDEDEVRREVGRRFGVRHALVARLAMPPGRVSLELSLYQTDGDKKLWSETYAGSTNDIVELETKALERIVSTLGLKVTATKRQEIHQKLTNNLEALRFYRLAYVHIFEGTRSGHTSAIEDFERALKLDPNFLEGEAGAAWGLYVQGNELPHREVWPRIRTRMRKVLEKDDTHFRARLQLVTCKFCFEWDWERAKADFEELKKENPGSHQMWAIFYRILGRTNEGRLEQEMAERSPPSIYTEYHPAASRFFTERRYGEAIRRAEEDLQRHPNDPMLVSLLGQCLVAAQRYPEAIALLQKGLARERKQDLVSVLACAYASMGDRTNALRLVQELEDLWRGAYVQPYHLARAYAALGDKPEVWRWLNKAVDDRCEFLVHADGGGLRTDPAWDHLREEPEFNELLKKVGLDVWPK
jgi:tetratricopeptide (TPR) repeat protein